MSQPSPQKPQVRRLLSPAERFGDAESEVIAPTETAPDPLVPLPKAPVPGGKTRRPSRRQARSRAPRHHEKRPHTVEYRAVNPAPEAQPEPNRWDQAAQNSMARALLARKRCRTRFIIGRIALATLTLLGVWGIATALTAPQFEIKGVEVRGLQTTPAAKVEALTAKLVGQNIFRAPVGSLEKAVAALPTVAAANVKREWSWPPRLDLIVTERQPILRVGAGQNWWVADATGVPFRRAQSADDALYALTAPQLQPSTGKALPAKEWARARELVGALQTDNALAAHSAPEEKFWQLRRLYLDRDGAASIRVSGAGALKAHRELLIRLGEDDWPAKLASARVALAYFQRTGRRADELDLVSLDHPRWRPRAMEKAEKLIEQSS